MATPSVTRDMGLSLIKSVTLIALLNSVICEAVSRELTLVVGAGSEECFFESVLNAQYLEVEYQVIDGGQNNDMEIT